MTGYIGVNNLSKKISSMYIGVNNLSKKVNKAYIGVNSVSKLWYSGIDTTDPNTRYESKDLGTWSSSTDVDTFCSTYNHDNNYTGLKLGNYVTITASSSSYTTQWEIAGFDMEYNRTASDGNVYNNGYGICWIPKTTLNNTACYHSSASLSSGYKSSTIHTSTLNGSSSSVYSNLKNILGSHLIKRNVLLSTSTNSQGSTAYAWTTAYLTLMSNNQIGDSGGTKYDIGEANYKLPLFNYENILAELRKTIWIRFLYRKSEDYSYAGVVIFQNGRIQVSSQLLGQYSLYYMRPMMYLR